VNVIDIHTHKLERLRLLAHSPELGVKQTAVFQSLTVSVSLGISIMCVLMGGGVRA
jgi:hypothetical protein